MGRGVYVTHQHFGLFNYKNRMVKELNECFCLFALVVFVIIYDYISFYYILTLYFWFSLYFYGYFTLNPVFLEL